MLLLLFSLVGHTPLFVVSAISVALLVAWGRAACNVPALVFMCVRTFFTLLVPSYHVACPRRWRSCRACGDLPLRASLSFPALLVTVCGSLLAYYSLACGGIPLFSLCKQVGVHAARMCFVFLHLRVVLPCGYVWFPTRLFPVILGVLRIPPYHFACSRRWWSCCACGGMHGPAYPSLPCAPYVSGHVGGGWARLGYTSWSPLLAWLSFVSRVRCVA